MNHKLKNLIVSIIIILIVVILIAVYVFVIKKEPEQAPLISVTNSIAPVVANTPTRQDSSLTQDFLSLLLNVKNIKLNDTIFNDPAFISLSDSSIVLTPDGTEGRVNPFAPFGSDIPVPSPSSLETTTPSTTESFLDTLFPEEVN